jgi:hypothetical protein
MLYGQLTGYLAALVELLLPRSVTTVQLAGLALVGLQAAAGYVLLRCLRIAPMAALMVAIVSAAASTSLVGLEISEWQCAVIAALLALAVACVADAPRARFLAGAIVGISLLFRQDVGLCALVAVLVVSRSARPLIGLGLIVGPVVLILLTIVPPEALYEQLLWYPIVGTRVYWAVPDPLSVASGLAAMVLMALFVWGARACIVTAAIRALAARDATRAGLIVFALLCQLQTTGRGDFYHFAQAAGPALLCFWNIVCRPDCQIEMGIGGAGRRRCPSRRRRDCQSRDNPRLSSLRVSLNAIIPVRKGTCSSVPDDESGRAFGGSGLTA